MDKLKEKQEEFNKAVDSYHNNFIYRNFNKFISFSILAFQIFLGALLFKMKFNPIIGIVSLIGSFILADLIGGLVHMYMDNNSQYSSIFGPFIAIFHLHHQKPIYKDRNIALVYFYESGSKHWLLIFYVLVSIFNAKNLIQDDLFLFLYLFGLFSTIAEVSHYLCHNSRSKIVLFLQKCRILLPKKHHLLHHKRDNMNYSFLNGVSDPIVNFIARRLYAGYKNNTDKHAATYVGNNTDNR